MWDALSTLFLDTQMDDADRQRIARLMVGSKYSPSELQTILWEELYPVLEVNLRDPLGEWAGFDLDWLQQQILSGGWRRTLSRRLRDALPYSPARIIRKEWNALLPFLPESFQQQKAT